MNFGGFPQNVNMLQQQQQLQQQQMMMSMGYGQVAPGQMQMPGMPPMQAQSAPVTQANPGMGIGMQQQFMPNMSMTSFGMMNVNPAPNPLPPTQPPPPPGPPPGPPPDDEQNKITMLQSQAKMWQEQKRMMEQQEAERKRQEEQYLKQAEQNSPEVAQCLVEEKQFQEQYDTWKKQFDDWKEQNKDHPDKEQYRQYEEQWKTYEYEMDAQKTELARRRQEALEKYKQIGSQPSNQQWNAQSAPPPVNGQGSQDMDWEQPSSNSFNQQQPQPWGSTQQGDNQRGQQSQQANSWNSHQQTTPNSFQSTPTGQNAPQQQNWPNQQQNNFPSQASQGSYSNYQSHPPPSQQAPRSTRPGQQYHPSQPHQPGQQMQGGRLQQPGHQMQGGQHQESGQRMQGARPRHFEPGQQLPGSQPRQPGQQGQGIPGSRPRQPGPPSQGMQGARPRQPGPQSQGMPGTRPRYSGSQQDWAQRPARGQEQPNSFQQRPQSRFPRSSASAVSSASPATGPRPLMAQGNTGYRGSAPRATAPPPGVGKSSKGVVNANLERGGGKTAWPTYNPSASTSQSSDKEPFKARIQPLMAQDFTEPGEGVDMYDEQKKLIEQLMGTAPAESSSSIIKADTSLIPAHKRKKPVVSEMTSEVIRKGTLSMVLSAYQNPPKADVSEGENPPKSTDDTSNSADIAKETGDSNKDATSADNGAKVDTPVSNTDSATSTSIVTSSTSSEANSGVISEGDNTSASTAQSQAAITVSSASVSTESTGQTPAGPTIRPAAPGQQPRPLRPGQRPMAPGQRPMAPGQRPMAPGQRPMAPGQRPMAPGQRPMVPGQRPIAPGQRPLGLRQRPPGPGQRPMVPGQRPLRPGQRPMVPGQRPLRPRMQRPMVPGQRPFGPSSLDVDPSAIAEAAKALSSHEHDLIKKATQDLQRSGGLPHAQGRHHDEYGYGDHEEEEYYDDEGYRPDPRRRNLLSMEEGYDSHRRFGRMPPPRGFRDDPYDRDPYPRDPYDDHYDDPYERFEAYRPETRYRRGRPQPYEDPYFEDEEYFARRRGRGLLMAEPYPPRVAEDEYDEPFRRRPAMDPYERHQLARQAYQREMRALGEPPLPGRGPPPARGGLMGRDPFSANLDPFARSAPDPYDTSLPAYGNQHKPEVIDYSHGPGRNSSALDGFNSGLDVARLPASFRKPSPPPGFRERSPIRLARSPPPSTARPPVADLFDAYSTLSVPEITDIKDLICKPKRSSRPAHLCLIVRGPPGAGKTYCSKLIRDKEAANGGSAPRILNLDDYFMVEVERLITDKDTGRKMKRKMLEYEYESEMESSYRADFLKSFKKTVEKGYFSFIIVDAVNDKISHFEEFAKFARGAGFQVYIVDVMADAQTCFDRNIHHRSLKDIKAIINNWEETPSYFHKVDMRGLLQDNAITDIEMEDSKTSAADADDSAPETDSDDEVLAQAAKKSKWETDADEMKLDKLDGLLHKKTEGAKNMGDFLTLPDDYEAKARGDDGKKHVRWADLEEKRLQDRDRQIGFVVGQTNWNRMLDDDYAEKQLNKTKYI